MKIDPNGPAYPVFDSYGVLLRLGMTIRLEVASRVLAGTLADPTRDLSLYEASDLAVKLADALIARLNEEEKP